jgi:hypothetical protein
MQLLLVRRPHVRVGQNKSRLVPTDMSVAN